MSQKYRVPRVTATVLLITQGLLSACGTGEAVPDARRIPEAEHVLDLYLTQSRVGAVGNVDGTLFSCDDKGASSNMRSLGFHRILGSSATGDTAVVRAQIATVARVNRSADGFDDVVPETSVDTLAWNLLRRTDDPGWGICGYSIRGGVDFVNLANLGPTARWPSGVSIATLVQVADSVYQALSE